MDIQEVASRIVDLYEAKKKGKTGAGGRWITVKGRHVLVGGETRMGQSKVGSRKIPTSGTIGAIDKSISRKLSKITGIKRTGSKYPSSAKERLASKIQTREMKSFMNRK